MAAGQTPSGSGCVTRPSAIAARAGQAAGCPSSSRTKCSLWPEVGKIGDGVLLSYARFDPSPEAGFW